MRLSFFKIYLVILALTAVSCLPKISKEKERSEVHDYCINVDGADKCERLLLSIINLIATPKTFQGMQIRTAGYLSVDQGHGILYLDETSSFSMLALQGVRLENFKVNEYSGFSNGYVFVEGEFRGKVYGERNPYCGTIFVSHIEPLPKRKSSPHVDSLMRDLLPGKN